MNFNLSSYHNYRGLYVRRLRGISQEPITQASLALIFSLLTVCIFGIFAIKPTLVTIAELTRTIKDKKIVDQQLQEKIEALNTAQTNYEAMKPYFEKMDKIIPEEAEFIRLLSLINLLAFENQVAMEGGRFGEFILVNKGGELVVQKETVAPSAPVLGVSQDESQGEEMAAVKPGAEKNLNELTFSLNLKGGYQNLKNFITQLNKIDRLVVIEEDILTLDSGQEAAGALLTTIKAKAFYL